jgi:cell division protein FtsB
MSALINPSRNRVPRIAEAAVERARLTVVPRSRQHASRFPFVVLVSVLLVGGVAGLLAFNTSMQQASFTATALQQRAAVLDAKEQSLQMHVQTLRDPQRLAVRARNMGMVPPSSPAFLRLSDGKVLGNPTPAVPAYGVRITPLPTRKPADLRPAPIIVQPDPKKAAGSGAPGVVQGGATGTKNTSTTSNSNTADTTSNSSTESGAGGSKH